MINLKSVISFFIALLLISVIAAGSTFSQPPGSETNQPPVGQNSQMGPSMDQGGPGGGQTQQGSGQGQGFGQPSTQGQQPGQMQRNSGQMQNMITARLKQFLGSTDEEWTIIGPKVLKVYSLVSSQSMGFQMRSLMGRSNNRGNTQRSAGTNRSSSTTGDKTVEDLQTLLQNENATTSQIKKQLSEVRNAREKAQEELANAQKELRELLTLKQEAILVSVGLLE